MQRFLGLVLLVGGCGGSRATPDAQVADAQVAARCDPGKPFGAPTALAEINSAEDEHTPSLAPDELTIYFTSARPGGAGEGDMYLARRSSTTAPFGTPVRIEGVNTAGHDSRPILTGDGLTLYSEVNIGTLEWDIASSTRSATSGAFTAPAPVPTLNSASVDVAPFVLPDHSAIYFASARSGDNEIYRAVRTTTGFGTPALVAGVNLPGTSQEDYPAVTPDELVMYFTSDRSGGGGGGPDLWRASRASASEPFGAPVPLTTLNTAGLETAGWVSADDCSLYFARGTAAGRTFDLHVATRPL
ncbi:MAG: hypothetical protein M3680_19785 [Myxococcota bacterium]|nr:hypothetical protein [Myxococcota bacterium]